MLASLSCLDGYNRARYPLADVGDISNAEMICLGGVYYYSARSASSNDRRLRFPMGHGGPL